MTDESVTDFAARADHDAEESRRQAGALEEGKADILGLYMIRELNAQGEMGKD